MKPKRTDARTALTAAVLVAGVLGLFSLLSAEPSAKGPRTGAAEARRVRDATDRTHGQRPAPRPGVLLAQALPGQAQRHIEELEKALRREREARMRLEERIRREQEMRRPDRPGPRREGEPHPGPEPPFRPEQFEQFRRLMAMVEQMNNVCFRPEAAAMVAVAGLRDDVPREPEQVAEDLEETLRRTRSLGLRNAIRLVLRDVYMHLERPDRVLAHLHEMLAENDRALSGRPGREEDRPEQPREPPRPEEPPDSARPEPR